MCRVTPMFDYLELLVSPRLSAIVDELPGEELRRQQARTPTQTPRQRGLRKVSSSRFGSTAVISGRVKVIEPPKIKSPKTRARRGPGPRKSKRAGEGKRYRKDPAMGHRWAPRIKGGEIVKFCASIPIAELRELDAMAERCSMSRSQFIRQAVKHFGAKIFPDGAPR